MNQPLKLQLNAAALEALFPPGSDARIELQNAVVAEFTRKHIKESALGSNVQDQIERARADALNAVKIAKIEVATRAIADIGVIKEWGRVKLTGEAEAAIKEGARVAVRDEISKIVQEQIQLVAEKLRGTVSHDVQAAINRMVDREISDKVKARVAAVVDGLAKVQA